MLYFCPKGTSRNRRERAKFVPTGLANTGHVPSVRRAPELTDSPTQQVSRSSPKSRCSGSGRVHILFTTTNTLNALDEQIEVILTIHKIESITIDDQYGRFSVIVKIARIRIR